MGPSAIAPAPASISPRLAAAADDGSASPYGSDGHQEASAWVAARLHGEDFAKGTGEKGKKKKPLRRHGDLDAQGFAERSSPIIP